MVFLDPKNDCTFRCVFGDERKKPVLMSFLNSVLHLPEGKQITEVSLKDVHLAHQIRGTKESILDVCCTDQAGVQYIVEMQVFNHRALAQRILYYVSKSYSLQIGRGKAYEHLKPIIFLGILDFNFTKGPHYMSDHLICDVETREQVFTDFRFTLIELPKFTKTAEQLETVAEKWIYFLKNAPELEHVPEVIHEAALKSAFDVIREARWTPDELMGYEKAWIYEGDLLMREKYHYSKGQEAGLEAGRQSGLEAGRKAGRKAGRRAGRKSGLEAGRKAGVEAGLAQGQQNSALAIAQTMLNAGLPLNQVVQLTGLSAQVVADLEKSPETVV